MPRIRKRSRGTGNRATVKKNAPHTVGRGPVPRHAIGYTNARGGNPLGCADGIRGPPRYGKRNAPHTVGRGPVPRHASDTRTLAGDRPPRYGNRRVSESKPIPLPRRARACPSPCLGYTNNRGGQAPALREHRDQEGSPTGALLREVPQHRHPESERCFLLRRACNLRILAPFLSACR